MQSGRRLPSTNPTVTDPQKIKGFTTKGRTRTEAEGQLKFRKRKEAQKELLGNKKDGVENRRHFPLPRTRTRTRTVAVDDQQTTERAAVSIAWPSSMLLLLPPTAMARATESTDFHHKL